MTPELILSLIGVITGFIALIVVIATLSATVYPVWSQYRKQHLLKKKFSLGPYDEYTIEQSTRHYIRPKCSNIDPAQEIEIRRAAFAPREDLFSKVDEFLSRDDGDRRHLLILADSGTGKTSFVLNYYAHNSGRPKRTRHNLTLVPLGDKRADDLIKDHPDQRNTAIFLDALDEDTGAIKDHRQRITNLMEACSNYKRVIITSRTQFFPKDAKIPIETGIARLGPQRAGQSGMYEFWKLYLSPFDDDEVRQYLKKRYPFWSYRTRRKAQEIARKIPQLTAWPMLLAHIPDLIASGREITDSYELYEVMVDAWLERETAWRDKAALREFSERLAVDLHVNRAKRGTERVPENELEELAREWGIELQDWQLSGRSLLNRDAEGNYKFSHRSIMEFLFVKRLVTGNSECRKSSLTDQMERFLQEADLKEADLSGADLREIALSGADLREANLILADLKEADLSWANLSGAYLSWADLSGTDLSGADLSWADLSEADLHRTTLSGTDLSRADLSRADLRAADLREADLRRANLSEAKIDHATQIDDKWRLVLKIATQGAIRRDLSETDLREADLREANLSRANLSEADLRLANLSGANLSEADLRGANLSGTDLRKANLIGANLSWADLHGANPREADLRLAKLSGADLSWTDLSQADLSGADLREATLSRANLSEADLRTANLSRAYLREADLREADLRGAKYTESTRWPDSFDPIEAGAVEL